MAIKLEERKTKNAKENSSSRISFFAMIADPIRHTIINELLYAPELSVNQLLNLLNKPQTLISYHLRCLRECGVLISKKSEKDGRNILYSLHDRTFIKNLFDMADNFLLEHEVCRNHPACRIKLSDP